MKRAINWALIAALGLSAGACNKLEEKLDEVTATGGADDGSGGSDATGGADDGSGGMDATGGADATGGMDASGGTDATGGMDAAGGMDATGGADATGGMDASGGTDATGGMGATGGMDATGGTTDTSASCDTLTCGPNSHCEGDDGSAACVCDDGYVDDPFPGTRCSIATNVVWNEDFESGYGNWSVEGGVWQIGEPTDPAGPSAHGGTAVAATVLDGAYPNATSANLISPAFDVAEDAIHPRLEWWNWRNLRPRDSGGVSIQFRNADGTWSNWQALITTNRNSAGWTVNRALLADYRGRTVRVAFWIRSINTNEVGKPGYLIDDVAYLTGNAQTVATGFESGLGEWSSWGGEWAAAKPQDVNAPAPRSGTSVAGTKPDGDYLNAYTTSVISPIFQVPDDVELPRMRYWTWHKLRARDTATVQVQIQNGDGSWGNWQAWETLNRSGDGWTQRFLHFSELKGRTIRVLFQLQSLNTNEVGEPGFFVDDVSFESGPMAFEADSFENGFADWSSIGGLWSVGSPSWAEAPDARTGANAAGVVLDGPYPNAFTSWLVSPALPIADDALNPAVRYWAWHSLRPRDVAGVQISFQNADGSWSNFQNLETVTGKNDAWSQRVISLSAYTGRVVRISFFVQSLNTNEVLKPGFYLDDVEIVTE